MFELFQSQANSHASSILESLLEYDKDIANSVKVVALMNAASSIKQSALLVNYTEAVEIASIMEDYFKSIQYSDGPVKRAHINTLLKAANLLRDLAETDIGKIETWTQKNAKRFQSLTTKIAQWVNENQAQQKPDSQLPSGMVMENNNASPVAKLDENTGEKSGTDPREDSGSASTELADETMLELFRIEAETLTAELGRNLLELEANPEDLSKLESMMRASHSIKGAARMVNLTCAVELAHLMEDCFVATQKESLTLTTDYIDVLLKSVDLLEQMAHTTKLNFDSWLKDNQPYLEQLIAALKSVLAGEAIDVLEAIPSGIINEDDIDSIKLVDYDKPVEPGDTSSEEDRVLRVTARRINTLMGLSSEFVVASTWIGSYSESLLAIKRKQSELVNSIDRLRGLLENMNINEQINDLLGSTQIRANECRQMLSNRLNELEEFDRRTVSLAGQMNHEVLASRMRPFADGVQGFQRMVRDLARGLNKKIELVIEGMTTQVDRDILERIEAPLSHIIRNAIDHGIESPEERLQNGKSEQGTIRINANHNSGMLSISVSDNGRGIDIETLRQRVVDKNMVHEAIAADLSDSELLEFLFLPGFSTRDVVTELSGRGVGLDVAHSVVQEMRGKIRASTELGKGSRVQLQLPLTLSVVRCLLIEIAGEPYAFPLARIESVLDVPKTAIQSIEDRQYIVYERENIGLINAAQVLDVVAEADDSQNVLVVIIGDRQNQYGLVVDKSLGEHSLAIQPLEAKLGKIRDISAAAVLNDGSPVLIIDVDDMIRSIDNLISGHRLNKVQQVDSTSARSSVKRVLVVDDSLTVREVERKLLQSRGYEVDVAVDGMDGWNTVRVNSYDLVITDVDMPRMNGIEFVKQIKEHPKLRDIPVMIVSYKDREEDRQRGLDVGADYYLTKGSFHDDSLIDAVIDLIGHATK
jgi:two-component system sensor histidine kinase and response regulator WspE